MYRWYVINTYSGHENKVRQNLEHRRTALKQQRAIRRIVVPTETVQEVKDNQKIEVEKRTMPAYVLVEMNMTEDSWQLVKGTPGVIGFVGAADQPAVRHQALQQVQGRFNNSERPSEQRRRCTGEPERTLGLSSPAPAGRARGLGGLARRSA
jgi:transcriptional antiterminator NusG